MSYLGYANSFYHLGHIIRGYLVAPPSLSHAVRFLHHWAPTVGTLVGWRGTPLCDSTLPLDGGRQMLPLRLP
jgi:hypothetical protein